jgi:hypothetical protein
LQKVSAVETEKCQVRRSPFGIGSEYYRRYISENIEIKINRYYFAKFPTRYKPISWETYMQSERWSPEEGFFVGLVFGGIGIPSSISPLLILKIPCFVAAWYWWYLSPIITVFFAIVLYL